jgi:DNA repair protein RadC
MEQKMKPSELLQIAEIELVYRSKVKASLRPQINTSQDAYEVLLGSWDADKIELVEQFAILLLNKANKVLGMYKVSTGGIAGTVADPRIIFASAIKANACALILVHNHPSGNLKPSRADEELTTKIKKGGDVLDIKVLDHLIITKDQYYSFADEGLL